MRAFFAMLWDPGDPRAAAAAANIRAGLDASPVDKSGMIDTTGLVLADLSIGQAVSPLLAARPTNPGEGSAAVFGTLFPSPAQGGNTQRIRTLEGALADRSLRSGGRTLLDDAWGSYVAFVSRGGNVSITCDPGASIPCYYTQRERVLLAFSHLERCQFIGLDAFTVNYGFLSRLLAYDRIQTGETGLNEVRELLGGQVVTASSTGTRAEQAWDPRTHAARPARTDTKDAAAALMETAAYVTKAWASQYDPVHLDLSGGFDSSALAGLLAGTAPTPVVAVHQRLLSEDPLESGYAQAAASHAGLAYREIRLDPRQPLPGPDTHPLSARPQRQFIGMDLSGPRREAGLPVADACFTGQGGDHLFLADKSPLGFCDYLRIEGLTPQLGEELLNAAHISGLSVWGVLHASLPRFFRTGESDLARSIAARRGRHDGKALTDLPAWMSDPCGLPPAKFNQACNLMHMVQVREQFDRAWARNVVHPYISQPLVELCLSLPTYTLAAGGVNRGLARQAFKGLLPERVRLRMTKGSSTGYFMDYLMFNHGNALGALRGGALESAGLISAADVNALALMEAYKAAHTGRRLLVWYAIEAWLRAWGMRLGATAVVLD